MTPTPKGFYKTAQGRVSAPWDPEDTNASTPKGLHSRLAPLCNTFGVEVAARFLSQGALPRPWAGGCNPFGVENLCGRRSAEHLPLVFLLTSLCPCVLLHSYT